MTRKIELPPLPKPFGVTSFIGLDEIVDVDAYGRDQMIGFARAAVEADRAGAPAEPEQPAAWITGPHGVVRANPAFKWTVPQSVEWCIPLYLCPQPVRSDAWVAEAMRLADEYAERRVREVMSSLDDFEPPEHSVDDARAALEAWLLRAL